MCILFVDKPHLMDGWGCCRCRSYNGLHRDECKVCGEKHCDLGLPETPDVIKTRD